MFELLVRMGYKEIEVGFPAASQTDFDFVRLLVEEDDPRRRHRAGADAGAGAADRAHLRVARRGASARSCTCTTRRRRRSAASCSGSTAQASSRSPSTPRNMCATARSSSPRPTGRSSIRRRASPAPSSISRKRSATRCSTSGSRARRKVIINLPATVEMATPNVFADQIEWMHRNLARRDRVVLSVHPHNDRGCGVAAAELAQMAGAERVEGCLFGNGERTGQRLPRDAWPQPVHAGRRSGHRFLRHRRDDPHRRVLQPAAGASAAPVRRRARVHRVLGLAPGRDQEGSRGARGGSGAGDEIWDVPYLPIDPSDVGRTYEAVIRVNSQSGKGGIAYLLERDHGLALPRLLQIEFSQVIQAHHRRDRARSCRPPRSARRSTASTWRRRCPSPTSIIARSTARRTAASST